MDKQTNVLANTQNTIPVNTRTIGAPEGIYILYLEDYVHTFIKKILSDIPKNVLWRDRRKREEYQEYSQEYQVERTSQQEIVLYGRAIEENGRYRIVISGAAVAEGGSEKIQQLNDTYFPSCSYIGNAIISLNKDSKLRLELTLRNTKVILDDFYIYYDQNEEMQNYLVEWNTTKENDKSKVAVSPTEYDVHTRGSANDAAHLSRITQAYNREEAKVSFMWNVMNVLCLGFVVCVMAYGIISMNNYNKMQNMQANIDYCMAFIEKNTSFLMSTAKTNIEQSQPVSATQQNVQAESGIISSNESQNSTQDTNIVPEEQEVSKNQTFTQPEEIPETTQALAQASVSPATQPTQSDIVQPSTEQNTQSTTEQDTQPSVAPAIQITQSDIAQPSTEQNTQPATAQPAQSQSSTPQYYVVRRGDTLRTICYDIYGDYSRVDEICKWNNIENPDNILYGQKLLLP